MQQGILVFQAKDLDTAAAYASKRRCTWVYLGTDNSQRERIAEVLGPQNRYLLGRLLHEVASQYKQPVLDFIADLGLHQKNQQYWWASKTAYQNPLGDDFFLLWCFTVVFEVVRLEHDKDSLVLVLVEDPWLYRQLKEDYRQKGAGKVVFLSAGSLLWPTTRVMARGLAGRVLFLFKAIYKVLESKYLAPKPSAFSGVADRRNVYLYTWVKAESFDDAGAFHDSYFGELPAILTRRDVGVLYVSSLFLSTSLKKKCLAQDAQDFIFLDQYVTMRDVIRSVLARFRIDKDEQHQWMRTLLQRQALYEIASFPRQVLYRLAFTRWLRASDESYMTVVYPFKNQPWERMLCMAADNANKDIALIGYQHSAVAPLELNYFVGATAARKTPMPTGIITSGEIALYQFRQAGFEGVEIVNGGSFRYGTPVVPSMVVPREKGLVRTVLVAMPPVLGLGQELLLSMVRAFGRSQWKDKLRVLVAVPQDVPIEELLSPVADWPSHFQFEDRPLKHVMKKTDVVVYTSTQAGLDALLSGVPVVKYLGESGLNVDPLDMADDRIDRIIRACSAEDLQEVVLSTLNEDYHALAQEFNEWKESLSQFYSPMDEAAWRRFIGSGGRMKMYMAWRKPAESDDSRGPWWGEERRSRRWRGLFR